MSQKISKYIPQIIFFSFLFLYIHNLSRSVYGGDVGDFLAAISVTGVAHPPGYPLFTILGIVLIHLLPFMYPAFAIGLISAFSNAFSVLLFYLVTYKLTSNKVVSIFATCVLGFSYLFWFYGEIAEVFALNVFFALLLLYLGIEFYKTKKQIYFLLTGLVAGFALTNHHTIITVFPGIFVLLSIPLYKLARTSWVLFLKSVFMTLGLFVIGLLVYIYVPVAASHKPPINWDQVHDINSFLRLFFRRDYGTFNAGVFAAPNLAQRIVILKLYLMALVSQMTIPVTLLSLLGLLAMFKKEKVVLLALIAIFLISGPLFVSYAGFPIASSFYRGIYERFFVLSSVFAILPSGIGFLFVIKLLSKVFNKKFIPLFYGVFFIVPLLLFHFNFPKTNLSNVWIGDNLGYDYLNSLPKNAVIILTGDTSLFNTWYIHYGRHVRTDVQLLNQTSLNKDIYFLDRYNELKKHYPKLTDNELSDKTISSIASSRPLFSLNKLQPAKRKITWVPMGLSFQYYATTSAIPEKEEYLKKNQELWSTLHVPSRGNSSNIAFGNFTISDIPMIYAQALLNTGSFIQSQYHDSDTALQYFKRAIVVDPQFAKSYALIGVSYLNEKNQCKAAIPYFMKSIELEPVEKISYFLLYAVYKDCIKDTLKADKLKKDYESYFKSSFMGDLQKTLKSFD